jgi:hypothetical protein
MFHVTQSIFSGARRLDVGAAIAEKWRQESRTFLLVLDDENAHPL